MSQSITLKCKGLWSFPNRLSEIPDGALLQADNVVSDRNGIIESRRGFGLYGDALTGSAGNRAKQLLKYKGRLIRHYDDVLDFDSGSGDFTTFDGEFNEVESGLRIKSTEANGNLLFTTINGIKKISAAVASQISSSTGFITNAGVVKAIDATGTVNYTNAGFFLEKSKIAYRVLWGIRDANNNLVLGAPSGRLVVTNPSETQTGTVDLNVSIPDAITTNHFFQVYRSAVKEAGLLDLDDIEPEDELYLVYEAFPTSTDISNGYVEFTDVYPEDFRAAGTLLYTNPITGEGINQANNEPPVAKDIATFKGTTYYANTRTRHQMNFTILSIDDIGKLGDADETIFTITNGLTTHDYTFDGEQAQFTLTFPAQANINSSGYFIIYSANDERKYVVWYNKTGSDPEPSAMDTDNGIFIEVNVSAAITASDVRAATKTAMDAADNGDFSYVENVADLTITNVNNGNATAAVDGSTAVATSGFTIATINAGAGENAGALTVLLSNNGSVGKAIDETARSLVRVINSQNDEIVYAYYLSSEDDLPGQILLENRSFEDLPFFLTGFQDSGDSLSSEFSPSIPEYQTCTLIGGTSPLQITATTHGLSTGNEIILFDTSSSPAAEGIYEVTVIDGDNFTVNFDYSGGSNASGKLALTTVFSTDEESPNRIYFSKYQQPEAVPVVNFRDVGSKDKPILRIIPLRDSLIVLKTDGIWRLTGEEGAIPSLSPTDYSAILIAPDSAYVLNNNIYALTSQGVTQISDSGVSIMSRQIEDQIKEAINIDNVETLTWGIGYESDRAYLLFTVTETDDEFATQCFRYNTFTNCWTRFPISKTCGVIGDDDKLYLGAGDTNFIEQERKNFNIFDYADRDFDVELSVNGFNAMTGQIQLSSTSNIAKGDAVLQVQYVTISHWNRLMLKLDIDAQLNDGDYFSTLELGNGDSLSTKMTDLVDKLSTDDASRITQTFTSANVNTGSDFITITGHGFVDAEIIRFSSSGSLPGGITAGTAYYVINSSANTFKITDVVGGDAIDITSGGSGTHTVTNDYFFSGTTDAEEIQEEYNLMIYQLNTSEGTFFTNYVLSEGTVTYFVLIDSISGIFVTPVDEPPFIAGIVTIFKAIKKQVIWAPETMEDPSMLKHVREATLMFRQTDFYNGFIGYRSDLSRAVEEVEYFGKGLGIWSFSEWSEFPWGGDGLVTPIRTLIPRQKQRCRFIECQWRHINSFENPMIEGISLTYETQSTKAYK